MYQYLTKRCRNRRNYSKPMVSPSVVYNTRTTFDATEKKKELFENIKRKEESAGNQQFLPFLLFSTL